eukprot:jgi/Psemu1/326493/estExt_fgenesh1_pg.C_3990008
MTYQVWEGKFSGYRVRRESPSCPSNKQRPELGGFKMNQAQILTNAERHRAFDNCELISDVKEKHPTWKEHHVIRERARRTSFHGGVDTKEAAERLDMDHVYIKFSDFLWGHLFIGINAMFLWKSGMFVLGIRETLAKWGIIKVPELDIESLIAKLCLEQSQVVHYFARTKKGSELGNIAGFFFPNFPYLENDLEFKVADLFAVDIDLDTKRFVKAKLDDENLTPMQTLILLWFNTIAAQHVKIHAIANWGVNDHASLKSTNPFLQQNSIVTIIYNYFGYTSFSGFLKTWEEQGFLREGWFEKNSLVQCFNHGIHEGARQHPHIAELVNDSEFVHFAVKVHAIFMSEFNKHKDSFPGIDGEALFVGTILHSLDHTLMEWNLCDPLWLDVNEPRFGEMAKMGRIVRVGFVSDVPFLYFHKRFKGSGHPFYEEVYRKAAKINKKLADHMDTCIIK